MLVSEHDCPLHSVHLASHGGHYSADEPIHGKVVCTLEP